MRTWDPIPKRDDFIFTIVPGQKQRKSSAMKHKRMTKAKHLQIANLFRSIALEQAQCPAQ
jgi:hypothetical protein